MANLLLKLQIKTKGKKGKLNDFLKDVVREARVLKHSGKRPCLLATTYVEDEMEFIKLYTPANRALIDWIREHKPSSVYAMAKILKKDVSNLSKTLRALAKFHLVRLEEGESVRRKMTPFVDWIQLDVEFPLSVTGRAA